MPNLLSQILERLTDNYNKSPESNIGKLSQMVAEELETLRETFERIELWRDIDEAEGAALDLIGSNVRQFRGQSNDEVYRILIKSKIARDASDSTINTIINVLSGAFGTDPSEIGLEELAEDPLDPKPAAIRIISVPINVLNAVGLSPNQVVQIVKSTIAAAVRLEIVELVGTFEFSSQNNAVEQDPDTGFADDAQTIGGILGELFAPEDSPDLPI